MASARIHFTVGLFMTVGMLLATLLIIWLGMSSFLRQGELYVTYFDESVQGLNIDSPVKYRGVPVGRVKDIRIAPDYRLIEVLIVIENPSIDDKFAESVARLASVGITGAMFVEIDRPRSSLENIAPELSFAPPYPVIISRPSNIKKLFGEIEEIAVKIRSIDFEGISNQAMAAFSALNASVEAAQIGAIASDIRALLATINTAMNPKRLESIAHNTEQTIVAARNMVTTASNDLAQIGALAAQLQNLVQDNRPHVDTAASALASAAVKADTMMTQSQATMAQMHITLKDVQEQLAATTYNLEQTTANLNALIIGIRDQPSQLLFSAPKPPRPIEQ